MLCANLLYQGTISFYIPFVMLISFFKNKNDDFSTYVKKNFKSIVIYASVFLLGCVIEYDLLHLYLKIFNYSSGKVGKVYIIQNIKLIIDMFFTILSTLRSMMFPLMFNVSWILLLLFITSRCVIDFKNKYKFIIYSLVVLILTLASPFIPNIMMPTNDNYTAPRLLLSFGAGVGFLSLCSLLIFDKKDKNLNNYYHILVLIITCVFFICSSNSILYNSYKDYQRYRYDVEYLNDFKDVINKYELDNNTKIKEIYFSTKSVKKPNYLGVHYNINNIRVASSNWGFVCGVNGLINRDYKVTKMDNDIYEKMVEDNESIIFDGDKLFILLE